MRKKSITAFKKNPISILALSIFILSVTCLIVLSPDTADAKKPKKECIKEYVPVPIDVDQVEETFLDSVSYDNLDRVHTYDEVVAELERIARKSKRRVKVGPLVNTYGTGLLPVDTALMADIINTVPEIEGLERNSIENFGLSTQGREIMAARVGKKGGRKVIVIAQQHGNEVTSTEAVLHFLKYLAFSKGKAAKTILKKTDVLFVVRANPDGGEPDPVNCLMSDQIPYPSAANLEIPTPYADGKDCGLHRFNVDPQAGFLTLVDGNLFGATAIGYDMNRYHFANFEGPIYPFETQALIYALKVFQPEFMLDLHNQNIKSRCDATYEECTEGSAGILVDGTLQAGPIIIDPENPDLQMRTERLAAHLLKKLNKSGTFTRFAQVSSSLQSGSRTSVDAAMELGIVGHWLEVRCPSEVIKSATITDGTATYEDCVAEKDEDGNDIIVCTEKPRLGGGLGRPSIDEEFDRLVRFHETGIREYLLGVAEGIGDITDNDGGFKTEPAWDPPNYDLFIPGCQYMYNLPYNPYAYLGYPDFTIFIGPIY